VNGFLLGDGTSARRLTGIDDHSRFCVSAWLMLSEGTQGKPPTPPGPQHGKPHPHAHVAIIHTHSMATVEQGLQSQLRNIEATYGHSIDELTKVIAASGLTKHTQVVAMLKQRYGMAHGAAHRVGLVARDRLGAGSPAGARPGEPAVTAIYEALLARARSLGPDVEEAPKKGYVSLRRRRQFAMLQPAAKHVNVGLVLPGVRPTSRLAAAGTWNALFTHRVRVESASQLDGQLTSWLQDAYRAAG
jgi:hypothetical protein